MMSVVRVLTVDRCEHHRIAAREFIIEGDSWSPIGAVIEHHSALNGLAESKSLNNIAAAASKQQQQPVSPCRVLVLVLVLAVLWAWTLPT